MGGDLMPLHVIAFGSGCLVGGFIVACYFQREIDRLLYGIRRIEERARAYQLGQKVTALYRAHEESNETVIQVEASTDEEAWQKLMGQ